MEMERRPAAARRRMDAPRATRATPIPACDGELVARMEASRRGKAARRLGLFQTRPGAIDAIDAIDAVLALAPLRLAGAGAAAEMERRRRPRAAARWARGRRRARSVMDASEASEQDPHGISGVSLADTACARMERARRPRAAARAETLRLEKAPRSILHPEHVGAFAMAGDAERDAERAFADWRSHGGWTVGEKDSLETNSLEMDALESFKSAASASRTVPETDPFATLERMLETHLRAPSAASPRGGGSGTTSRGGSTRGAGAYAGAYASAFMHSSRSRSSLTLSGHGSSANLEREGSTLRGNAVPRRVRCSLEDSDVVCRAEDGDEVERVARDGVEAKIAALAETLERERLSAPPPVSR